MKSSSGQFEPYLEAFGLKNPYANPYVHDASKDTKSKPVFDSATINWSPAADKPKKTISKRRSTDPVDYGSL